jgi:hypothetical protein
VRDNEDPFRVLQIKLPLQGVVVDIAYLPLRQDFLAKNVLMTAQRDFRLGNSLWKFDLDIELDKCIMYLSLHGEKRAVPSIAHLRDARDAEEKPFTHTQEENAKWIQTKY